MNLARRAAPREVRRRPAPPDGVAALDKHLHPVLRRVYAARGVATDELDPQIGRMLPVAGWPAAQRAAERLAMARLQDETVVVVADFDADGATSAALVVSCLRGFGFGSVHYLVPDRFRLGYGLSPAIVEQAAKFSPQLLITVDNGISSVEGCQRAADLGIEVIITDHHLPGASLPVAGVIVNPNLPDEAFAGKNLAGVGVAFYVMAALGRKLVDAELMTESLAQAGLAEALDLVALGTVADLVPLDFNNRVLVQAGLRRIRAGRARPGVAALFEASNRRLRSACSADLGFGLAPRLNAAGRLTDMSMGIECLLSNSVAEATQHATRLTTLNQERRELQRQMEAEALQLLDAAGQQLGVAGKAAYCLFSPAWHEGIVGLVATRARDQMNRPVIAFAPAGKEGELKGSARSIDGIHIRDVLDLIATRNPGLLLKFGGHARAAGISLRRADLARFDDAWQAACAAYSDALEQPNLLWSDGSLGPAELSLDLAQELASAGPWGQGFPEPVFDNELTICELRLLKNQHLKLRVRHPDSAAQIDAIVFNQTEVPGGGDAAHFCFRLQVNEFREQRRAQLVVEQMQSV